MAVSQKTGYEEAKRGLARVIRRYRSDCPPGETARLLLSYDTDRAHLIGITEDASYAIFLDRSALTVHLAGFSPTGLDRVSESIATFRSRQALDAWLSDYRREVAWLHPRYR